MRKKILISLISLILASGFFVSGALAEDKTILAVVDFAFSNVEIEGSKAITDTFRQELAKNKALQILSHDTVEAVFDKVDPMLKLKLSQSDCTDVSCGVRVGRDLGAQATILGTINKQENRYTVAAKLVNLEKRDVEFIVSQDCNSVKELSDATKQLAAKVLSSLPQPGETPEQTKQRRLALEKKEQEAEKKEQEAKQKELAQRKPGTCPEGMALIPASEFTNAAGKKIQVAEYCIDKYEFPNQKGARPSVKIEWFGAKEECEKQGKRLCTENEWEKACSGDQGNKYPYGNDYAATKCNGPDSGKNAIAPSGECTECVSSYGVNDMSGNAKEWTADWDDKDIKTIVTKGGSFATKPEVTSCGAKQAEMVIIHRKDNGFRCCK